MNNINRERLLKLPVCGVWSAILTPLTPDLSIDYARLAEHAKFLLEQGCHGIGLFGTTGEANSFSLNERMNGLESILKSGTSADRIMVGTGCCALPDTVALTKHAITNGIKRILLLPPFYYKNVKDEGLFNSFSEVIEQTQSNALELYLYHFPAMSQIPISTDLIARLCEAFPKIIAGVKDSSGDLNHNLELASQFPELSILPGNEAHLLAGLEQGCAGVISATANANSQGIRNVFDSWLNGGAEAIDLQKHAFAIREVFGHHPLVPALKQYTSWQSSDDNWLRIRPPLTNLAMEDIEILRSELGSLAVSPQ